MPPEPASSHLEPQGLLDALRGRRSRRFGVGMQMPAGPFAYRSSRPPLRLTEDEEALLAFAACGVTGPALGDLVYTPEGGGTIMSGLAGRTVASGDAMQTVSVVVVNEDAAWLLKRSHDFDARELPDLYGLVRDGRFTEIYRRSRVKLGDGRAAPPLEPPYNLDVNRWSLYDRASTYFLPVNELTALYINGLIEILNERNGYMILDERAHFRPAGLRRFARAKGGHLQDDPRDGRVLTIQQLEGLVTEFVTVEQGMVLQNLALMAQAMGLGGFPHWAAHPSGWLEALGFRMRSMPATRYLGMGRLLTLFARLLGRNLSVPHAEGLWQGATALLVPYCPPAFPSMRAAVEAVRTRKFGPSGIFRTGARHGAFRDPDSVTTVAEEPSRATVEATVAYCEYVHGRYGRFPAYQPPFRTVLGFQASHVDTGFYDRYYRPDALTETQREHMRRWHDA